ncbi:MAG: TraB/GumN family protein [Nanoarchaeota archaeon]
MQQYKKLILIGTSHIAIESVKEVRRVILTSKPNVVAIELDPIRLNSLLSKEKRKLRLRDISQLGLNGFLFNLIGAYLEKKLGKIVNVTPGDDMKAAVDSSKQIGAELVLIDQDVRITMKKLSRRITWHEKFRFVKDIIIGLVKREKIKINLNKVPDKALIEKLTNKIKERYPSVYSVLISERNEYMAKNLYRIMQANNSIVAVVGAGHEDEIIRLIEKQEQWNFQKKN